VKHLARCGGCRATGHDITGVGSVLVTAEVGKTAGTAPGRRIGGGAAADDDDDEVNDGFDGMELDDTAFDDTAFDDMEFDDTAFDDMEVEAPVVAVGGSDSGGGATGDGNGFVTGHRGPQTAVLSSSRFGIAAELM